MNWESIFPTAFLLEALDAFRFTQFLNQDERLDRAVEFMLDHWVTRKAIGPCHFGIGTLFMKIEYPFFRYNIFFYVYVLSFYDKARKDRRFLDALRVLESKLVNGKIVIENPNRKLSGLSFCRKGEPSELATKRYREILRNVYNTINPKKRRCPMRRVSMMLLAGLLAVVIGIVQSENKITVKTMPPVVVKTFPPAGDTAVDSSIKEIRVIFSKDMMTNNMWSWVMISKESFPTITGEVKYLKDKRTCVAPVKLEPGKTYAIWFNSEKYNGFRDTDNNPAIPYLLVFQTKE